MRTEATAVRVADLLERLARLLRSRGYAEGLNPVQWEALRYLRRCNRFSNNPSALASFLGATKGTVSQTLSALERKGLVSKLPRPGLGRSLSLVLSARARELLRRDPLCEVDAAVNRLGRDAALLGGRLAELLAQLQALNGLRSFGTCRTCRHFRAQQAPQGRDACALLRTHLAMAELDKICVEHVSP